MTWTVIEQGGGWLGRFGTPILRGLARDEGPPDQYGGVSVGALNVAMAAQGSWKALDKLWDGIDDGFALDGIRGYTRLALNKGGVWSIKPLFKKIVRNTSLTDIRTPCFFGVTTRDPFAYLNLHTGDMNRDARLHRAIAGSAAIAFVFQPVPMNIDGEKRSVRDGGHMHSIPWVPTVEPGDRIDVIVHHPLDASVEVPDEHKNQLVSELEWLVWAQFHNAHYHGLMRMQQLADEGADVRVWAPHVPLGGMLKADRETLEWRESLGQACYERGPIRL